MACLVSPRSIGKPSLPVTTVMHSWLNFVNSPASVLADAGWFNDGYSNRTTATDADLTISFVISRLLGAGYRWSKAKS